MATPPRIQSIPVLLIALCLCFCGCGKRGGADFDIPEGVASETFLEFARQAEVEILFDPENTRGVKTHAVSGYMSEVSALEIMIKDTGFYIHQDPVTDAIAIRMEPRTNTFLKSYPKP